MSNKLKLPKFDNAVMVIYSETSGQFFHIRGFIDRYDHMADKLSGLPYTPWDTKEYYGDLRVTSQAHYENGVTSDLYAQGYEFTPSSVTPDSAPIINFVLQHIKRKLAGYKEIEGAPLSFGQLVARVCRALGINKIIIRKQRLGETVLRHLSLGEAIGDIDHLYEVWKSERESALAS